MIFKFLTYIRPVWYFNKTTKEGKTVFPNPTLVPDEFRQKIVWDANYKSEEAKLRDASWQLFQKGYIGKVTSLILVLYKIHFLGFDAANAVQNSFFNFCASSLLNILGYILVLYDFFELI